MGSILVMFITFVLHLLAFALVLLAERKRTTGKIIVNEKTTLYCKYGFEMATRLAVVAFMFLLVAQCLIMFAARCLCCGRGLRPGGSRAWAITFFILSWVMFCSAELSLLYGMIEDNVYYRGLNADLTDDDDHRYSCVRLGKGAFTTVAVFVVLTGILCQAFYINYSKSSSYTDSATHSRDDTNGVRMTNLNL